MSPLTKIAALRALCEKATADKWLVLHIPDQPPIVAASCGAIVCRPPAPRDIRGTWDADAALIAELRNALPALLAVAEAAEEMRAFIGIMCGRGPNAVIPAEVRSPIGVPIKIGKICEDADTAIAQLAKEAQQ